MDVETKAYLISVGTVKLARPRASGRDSTAGPGAGGRSIFFCSGGRRVRLSVADSSPLRLEMEGGDALIIEDDFVLARGHLEEPLAHCPEQAYITVTERCIYDCKFCAVPKLKGSVKSLKSILNIVEDGRSKGDLKAIALTSGVDRSPADETAYVAEVVKSLRKFGVPIGVSVVPSPNSNEILRRAGAVEIKYNLETVDPDLFRRVCPSLSMEEITAALQEGVQIYGKNHVFSNVIVGLGETDRALKKGIDELSEIGVLPVLRAVYPHPLRIGETEMTRPSADRLLGLARYARKALDKHGLRGDAALTMCYKCTGCDLTPHIDL